jgi:hypothetical protein
MAEAAAEMVLSVLSVLSVPLIAVRKCRQAATAAGRKVCNPTHRSCGQQGEGGGTSQQGEGGGAGSAGQAQRLQPNAKLL